MKKIVIIGEAGRGKTTMANVLSEKLNIKHYSTDDFYWEVKYSKPREKEKALDMVHEVVDSDSWLIEGTTAWLIKPCLQDADTIIYLRFSSIFQQWISIIRRYGKEQNDTFIETIKLLVHVFRKRYPFGIYKKKITHKELIEDYKDKVVELDSYNKIDEFIENI